MSEETQEPVQGWTLRISHKDDSVELSHCYTGQRSVVIMTKQEAHILAEKILYHLDHGEED